MAVQIARLADTRAVMPANLDFTLIAQVTRLNVSMRLAKSIYVFSALRRDLNTATLAKTASLIILIPICASIQFAQIKIVKNAKTTEWISVTSAYRSLNETLTLGSVMTYAVIRTIALCAVPIL